MVSEFEKANDVLERTSVRLGEAMLAARGMYTALELGTTANKLGQSGLQATSEELAILTRRAIEYARATGIDESEALEKLTSAMIRGNARGLKPFGIEMDATLPRAEAFSAAVAKMGKTLEGTTTSIDDLNDVAKSVKNSLFDLGTVAVGAGDAFASGLLEGSGEALDGMSSMTSGLVNNLAEIKDAFRETGSDIKTIYSEYWVGLWDLITLDFDSTAARAERMSDRIIAAVGEINNIPGWAKEKLLGVVVTGYSETMAADAQDDAFRNKYAKDYAEAEFNAYEAGLYGGPQSYAGASTGALTEMAGRTVSRSGGGGRRTPRARDTRTVDEMFAPLMRDEITDEDLMSGMRGGALSGADQASADMMNEYAAAVDAATAAESSRLDVALQLAQVRGDEEAIKSAEMERIDFDREQAQARYEEGEITLEQLTLELELLQAKSNEIERQGTLAQQWSDAWEAAYGKTRPAQFAMNSLVTSYTNVVGSAIRAAVTYGASVKQALLEALAATASQIAVESGLKAILEMAEGLAATGRREYDSASSHFASAAMYGVLAAAAGAASYAASAGAARGAAKGAKGAQVAGGGYETPLTNGRQAREEDRTINVTLNLDGEVVYNSIQKTDRRRVVSGESRIGG